MTIQVALVEDEELIRTMLKINLEREGYAVTAYEAAEPFLEEIEQRIFDIILMDIMLPGIHGDSALEKLRKNSITTPVLMLTVKQDTGTKVRAFDAGADDYLPKPFNMDELLARVRALIRRSQGEREIPAHHVIIINSRRVNLETRTVETPHGNEKLSDREAELLAYFARNPGKTLNRSDILDEVWGLDVDPTPRTVDNFVVRFRRLFEDDPEHPKYFITVRAAGYRFEK
jgi:DNA-binding response OmpR family regulator